MTDFTRRGSLACMFVVITYSMIYRVPTQPGNREKTGKTKNIFPGREKAGKIAKVGENREKTGKFDLVNKY